MLPLPTNRVIFSSWWGMKENIISEKAVKDINDVGLDLIMTSRITNIEKINELLTYCDKYEIECYVFDTRFKTDTLDEFFKAAHQYAAHPSFAGNILDDEPGSVKFEELQTLRNAYKKEFPNKEPFINLLPMYASAKQLKYGASVEEIKYYDTKCSTYEEHLNKYVEYIDTPYICVDVYPCRINDGIFYSSMGYIENLNYVAIKCRESCRDLWVMMQSMGWGGYARHVDEIDMRWQAFCFMSFGVKNFSHYCYTTPGEDDIDHGMIDTNGNKCDTYFFAQRIHREIKAMENTYLSYKSLGAFTLNSSQEFPYMLFDEQYTNFNKIRVECSEPLLVGCFEKTHGNGNAFTLVNMTDLKDRKAIKVKVKTDFILTAYPSGLPLKLAITDGYYEFTLPCGEGIFITAD